MENIKELFTHQIKLPANNMREYINRDEIFELAEDIKKNGLINPITVRPIGDEFELVAGQRRFLAHQFGGIPKINCVVKNLTDDEALAVMTSENLARVDVNPVDEAKHVLRLLESQNNDIKKVSEIVSRSENWIHERIAIAEMPDYLQEYLGNKQIKIGVALVLAKISNDNYRRMWVDQAVRDGVSIAIAEYWLSDFKRRLLPGGELALDDNGELNIAPPQVVKFTCGIDGQQYDSRFARSVLVYEGNLEYFNAFVSAFRIPPENSES